MHACLCNECKKSCPIIHNLEKRGNMSGWLGHLVAFLKGWVILEPWGAEEEIEPFPLCAQITAPNITPRTLIMLPLMHIQSETVTRTDRVLDGAGATRMKRESQGSLVC